MSSAIVPLMDIGSDMSNALNIGADDGRKIANGMVMGMREKLVELLGETFDKQYDKNLVITASNTANYLVEHDVVLVVRCKDCKHYMTIHCTCDGCCISDDWYCADGERRTK